LVVQICLSALSQTLFGRHQKRQKDDHCAIIGELINFLLTVSRHVAYFRHFHATVMKIFFKANALNAQREWKNPTNYQQINRQQCKIRSFLKGLNIS
jgi:hypothetical protein